MTTPSAFGNWADRTLNYSESSGDVPVKKSRSASSAPVRGDVHYAAPAVVSGLFPGMVGPQDVLVQEGSDTDDLQAQLDHIKQKQADVDLQKEKLKQRMEQKRARDTTVEYAQTPPGESVRVQVRKENMMSRERPASKASRRSASEGDAVRIRNLVTGPDLRPGRPPRMPDPALPVPGARDGPAAPRASPELPILSQGRGSGDASGPEFFSISSPKRGGGSKSRKGSRSSSSKGLVRREVEKYERAEVRRLRSRREKPSKPPSKESDSDSLPDISISVVTGQDVEMMKMEAAVRTLEAETQLQAALIGSAATHEVESARSTAIHMVQMLEATAKSTEDAAMQRMAAQASISQALVQSEAEAARVNIQAVKNAEARQAAEAEARVANIQKQAEDMRQSQAADAAGRVTVLEVELGKARGEAANIRAEALKAIEKAKTDAQANAEAAMNKHMVDVRNEASTTFRSALAELEGKIRAEASSRENALREQFSKFEQESVAFKNQVGEQLAKANQTIETLTLERGQLTRQLELTRAELERASMPPAARRVEPKVASTASRGRARSVGAKQLGVAAGAPGGEPPGGPSRTGVGVTEPSPKPKVRCASRGAQKVRVPTASTRATTGGSGAGDGPPPGGGPGGGAGQDLAPSTPQGRRTGFRVRGGGPPDDPDDPGGGDDGDDDGDYEDEGDGYWEEGEEEEWDDEEWQSQEEEPSPVRAMNESGVTSTGLLEEAHQRLEASVDDRLDRLQKQINSGKKEAEKLTLPQLPKEGKHLWKWFITSRHAIEAANPHRPQEAFEYALEVDEKSYEELADETGWVSFGSKLKAAVSVAVMHDDEVAGEILLREQALAKEKKRLAGRQALWIVKYMKRTYIKLGHYYDHQDISNVKCRGRDLKALANFQRLWRRVKGGLDPKFDKDTLEHLYVTQIEEHPLMKEDFSVYRRAKVKEEPNGSYDFLFESVESVLEMHRHKRNRADAVKAIVDGDGAPAAPGKGKDAKGKGKGKGKGKAKAKAKAGKGKKGGKGAGKGAAGLERPANLPSDACIQFFKNGTCTHGDGCRYRHCRPNALDADFRKKPAAPARAQSVDKKNTPCKFFAEGKCTRGDQCAYKHPPAAPARAASASAKRRARSKAAKAKAKTAATPP